MALGCPTVLTYPVKGSYDNLCCLDGKVTLDTSCSWSLARHTRGFPSYAESPAISQLPDVLLSVQSSHAPNQTLHTVCTVSHRHSKPQRCGQSPCVQVRARQAFSPRAATGCWFSARPPAHPPSLSLLSLPSVAHSHLLGLAITLPTRHDSWLCAHNFCFLDNLCHTL